MRNIFTFLFSITIIVACASNTDDVKNVTSDEIANSVAGKTDTAYFAGGCFWCVEASFEQIKGVKEAISGYSGGKQKKPTYKAVSYGKTDHAESVMVIYDPAVITYETLLDIFFTAHDPTQLNRQGPDVGKQYRSAIFYTNEQEKKIAEEIMAALAPTFSEPIVTELKAFDFFHPAEDYHQDFEKKNPNNTYIINVSKPKIDKVAEKFKDRLK